MHRTTTVLVLFLLLLSGGLPAQTQGPKTEPKPPVDQGAGDPADFPRPPGLVRKSYSASHGVQRDEEIATYRGNVGGDSLIGTYTSTLPAEGWAQQARSDSGSGRSRVTIIDWEKPAREAEVRFYLNVAGGGTDLWVRVFTYKTAATAKAASAEAGPGTSAPVAIVPDLSGKTRSEAESLLKNRQLAVAWGPEKPRFTPNAVPDTVGGQSPSPGLRVARGSTVTLTPLVWSVTVPQVQGTYAQAEQALAAAHLRANRGPTTLTTNPALSDQVIHQDPAAGAIVHGDAAVTLTEAVLQGPVPDVVGRSYDQARSYLSTAAPGQPYFHVERASPDRLIKDSRQAGQVVAQSPTAGAMAPNRSTVTLTVAKWDNTGPVPNVVGEGYDDAVRHLQSNAVGGPRYQVQKNLGDRPNTNPSQTGRVAEQSPAAGAIATDGSTVILTLWGRGGPIPDVVGRSFDQARTYLSTAPPGQPYFHVERASPDRLIRDSRQAGLVVAQSPAAGTPAPQGSTVTLTVAKWDNTGPVPNVVGEAYDDAARHLQSNAVGGPRYQVQKNPGDKPNTNPSQTGRVAEQSPAAGAIAADGSTVTLTLWGRGGPIPDVVGRSYDQARSYLSTAAPGQPYFHVERASPDRLTKDSRQTGQVVAQSPVAGTPAPQGSTVTLTVATWDNTGPVPLVRGRSYADAQNILSTRPPGGISFHVQKAPVDQPNTYTVRAGLVADQSPTDGAIAVDGATVTLTLWSKAGPVPVLLGKTVQAARNTLLMGPATNAHFLWPETFSYKLDRDRRKEGTVAEQTPASNTMAGDGTVIAITLFRWDNTGPVPDVVGKGYDAASVALATNTTGGARFRAQRMPTDKSNTDPNRTGLVAEQNPAAGTIVADATTVFLTLWGSVGP